MLLWCPLLWIVLKELVPICGCSVNACECHCLNGLLPSPFTVFDLLLSSSYCLYYSLCIPYSPHLSSFSVLFHRLWNVQTSRHFSRHHRLKGRCWNTPLLAQRRFHWEWWQLWLWDPGLPATTRDYHWNIQNKIIELLWNLYSISMLWNYCVLQNESANIWWTQIWSD